MKRRLATSAALVAASLLLTACGSSDDGGGEAIVGADEGGQADDAGGEDAEEEEGEDAETPDDGIERPTIELPDDVELIFEDGETGDPELDAVLLDNQYRLMSLDEVITSGDMERPALGVYSSGDALRSAVRWLEPLVDKGHSFGGTVRYHSREASIQEGGWAVVTYCIDETDAFSTWRETGEEREAPEGDADHYFLSSRLDKDDATGIWQTTTVETGDAEGRCF